MILFESPLIRLEYTPATDILLADLSNRNEFYALELKEIFRMISTTVRHYDVKRLLMDSRNRIIAISDEEYAVLMENYLQDLQNTRLEKLARLKTGVSSREGLAKQNKETVFSFALETFMDKEMAIEWLLL